MQPHFFFSALIISISYSKDNQIMKLTGISIGKMLVLKSRNQKRYSNMNKNWISVWGNAMSIAENRPEGYGKNITLRYPFFSPFEGEKIRLTFDNYCGTEPVTISKVTICQNHKFYPVTCNGEASFMISTGSTAVTDPLDLSICANETLEISFYLAGYTQLRSAVFASGPYSEGLYAVGDQTENPDISIDISRKINMFYFLSNISVYTDTTNRHAIVCYGDSITAQAWPDYLKKRCQQTGACGTSVIRRATSGSRILREYSCITYESYGLKGTRRFGHEVPTDGADTVIIQQGINDIIHPVGTDINPFRPMSDLPTSQELIDGLKWYIDQSRALGYLVYVGTLLPINGWRTYAPFREELRMQYNDWIRSTDLIDGCIDFDLAVRSDSDHTAFAEGFDSGDHLHPSLKGYEAMADAIPDILLF